MRIISKFRDFYDGVMRTGMDREVVYLREEKRIELTENLGFDFGTEDSGNFYSVKLLVLGYCGQIIKALDLSYDIKRPDTLTHTRYRRVFFDYDEFKSFMLANGYCRKWDFDPGRIWSGKFERFRRFDTSKLNDIFHRYQTPLFLVTHKTKYSTNGITTIHLSPSLQKIGFQTFKDPYTTYQDIFQYVAGVLNRPETKMVKISDKDKIAKHGFDKWSFRQKGPKK